MAKMNNSQKLHTACFKGQVKVVKLLLRKKCDIESRDLDDQRPMHIACANGNVDIVKLLIKAKCDIEARDKNDWRPIHIACINGYVAIVQLLIEKKCDIEACDENVRRPIHFACNKRQFDIVKLLILKNCDIEARAKFDWRPIHIACDNGNADIVKLLIENKCDIEARDGNDQRPIHFACVKGHVDIVELLIEKKCDIEAHTKNDQRPIHIACQNGNVEIVKLLIEDKCDINAPDKNNWRPIHFATYIGSVEIVKLLIERYCDIKARTMDSQTPMGIAVQCNYKELINVIEYELCKDKLVARIQQASQVECGAGCDHKSCPTSLIPTGSQNKRVIGRGAYGKVYKLTDLETKMEYAVKSIKIYNEGAKKEVKNLEDDINSYRDIIKHPRIMEYFGSFSYSRKIYIFMEFFPKGSLEAEIQKAEFLQHQRTLRYTKQILEGVEFLHDKKIIHRDIKPGNILLDDNDCTKLCDFGTSKSLPSISIRSEVSAKLFVHAQTYCGTPNYMAPEVILTYTGVLYSFPADIWSVGVTIVHMLTGQPPYSDCRPEAVIFKIGMEKKFEFESREPMSDNMKLFVKETLNPVPSKRATAKQLLQFLIDHDMT